MLQEKVGTIHDHPTTQYEQFIERFYGRHKGSGQSKATVISNGQVILLDIRCDFMGGGGFQRHNDVILEKKVWRHPLMAACNFII